MIKYLLAILSSFLCISIYSQEEVIETATLTIEVTDIETTEGFIQIGLYNDPELFPKVNQQYKVAYFKIHALSESYTFENLDLGKYAVAIYHDLNSDKICNQNILGIPKEEYGFSNNIRPFLSAPSFKSCQIQVEGNQTISIKLE